MKLHEVAKQLDPHAEIRQWLDDHRIKNYTIRPDSVVDVNGDVDLSNFVGTAFPVQFGKVTGDFDCRNTKITSLIGCPQFVGAHFRCYSTEIKSLTGAPQSIGGNIYLYKTRIKSLSGVDKIIKHIGGDFVCNKDVTHLLGLLLIKGITSFNIDGANGPIDRILNKYLGTGDILSAQDELIDAGLIDQARL